MGTQSGTAHVGVEFRMILRRAHNRPSSRAYGMVHANQFWVWIVHIRESSRAAQLSFLSVLAILLIPEPFTFESHVVCVLGSLV